MRMTLVLKSSSDTHKKREENERKHKIKEQGYCSNDEDIDLSQN